MVKDIKTAIVGGVVGVGILLTVFCCEGKVEESAVIEEPSVEEVAPVEEVTPVEEIKESIEELVPAEIVE